MNKLQEILTSWGITFNPNEAQSKLAAKRIEVCNACEHKTTDLGVNRCSKCGCALKAKVYSPLDNPCPEKKWDFSKEEEAELGDDKRIFVQFASYRDPQLVPTMRNMLEKADDPDNLYFGICWQKDDSESLEEFADHPRVRYVTYDYTESKGLGWARAEVGKLHDGEPFTLQLDSHHRFAESWDTMMWEDYKQAARISDKPLITTYLTPFEVGEFEEKGYDSLNKVPCLMSQYEFSKDKLIMSMPWYIQDYESRNKVIRSRLLSGHFIFVKSEFLTEVPYDPDIYFGGYCEETTMALRAFTHGYDFYSPYRQYIWHEYTRVGRPKHWEDHGQESKTDQTSGERDAYARNKTRQLFMIEDYGIDLDNEFGLGSERTLQDFEEFCGFDCKQQRLQKYTLEVKEPPNPLPWAEQFEIEEEKEYTIAWSVLHFHQHAHGDYQFITLGIFDKDGNEIIRNDITADKYPEQLKLESNNIKVKMLPSQRQHASILMYGMKGNGEWTPAYTKDL